MVRSGAVNGENSGGVFCNKSASLCLARVTSSVGMTDEHFTADSFEQTHSCPLTYMYAFTDNVAVSDIIQVLDPCQINEMDSSLTVQEEIYLDLCSAIRNEMDSELDTFDQANEEDEHVLSFSRRGRAVRKPPRYRENDYY